MATDLVTSASSGDLKAVFGQDFTEAEVEVLAGLLQPEASVELVIPADIDPDQLWTSLDVCCSVIARMKAAGDKIKPIIGRMLVVIQQYPELIRAKGYKHFDDFMNEGMWNLFRISRSEAYYCKKIAEYFPSMTVDEFRQIGISKMQLLTGVTDETKKGCDKWIERAKNSTVTELKEHIVREKEMPEGSLDRDVITIPCTVDDKKRWDEFIATAEICAYCESELPNVILMRMLEEVSLEWGSAGAYFMNGGR